MKIHEVFHPWIPWIPWNHWYARLMPGLALRWLHSVIPTTVESTPSSYLVHG